MAGLVGRLLALARTPFSTTADERRKIINQLVAALTELADDRFDAQEHRSMLLRRLSAILQRMSVQIAEADDGCFSAIMTEAAQLLHSLEARLTSHFQLH
jgi:hypothetical protein